MTTDSPKRIMAKEAATIAMGYYRDVTGDRGPVNVEEIELDDDDEFWLITLSHQEQNSMVYNDKLMLKAFKIGAYSGEVLSMKIRKV